MKAKLSGVQVQRAFLAPILQQSINVLLLPIVDLKQTIEQELQNNPLLEIQPEKDPAQSRLFSERQLSPERTLARDERNFQDDGEKDHPEFDYFLANPLTLEDQLIQQMRLETSDPLYIKISELIIGNLDENGYLKVDCEEIARMAEIENASLVEEVLLKIQNLGPLGIGARNLQECLLLQLSSKVGDHALAAEIIKEHLTDLGRKKYLFIARKLQVSVEEVKECAHLIASLDPRPARNFRAINPNIYIRPDVFITCDEDRGYQVIVNNKEVPTLCISKVYENMLESPALKEDERNYILQRIENANSFIKSIQQRGQTLSEITKFILERQKDFFNGNETSIAPLNLKDVAEALHRNESTISRAINQKYMDTPKGLIPFKFFFSRAVASTTHAQTSAQAIKETIKEIIANESKALSDEDILAHFRQEGICLSRRTIAKYRYSLNIPPSYLRKN